MFPDWLNYKEAAMKWWDNVQTALSSSIDFNGLEAVQFVFGNTLTVALQLSLYVFVAVLFLALVVRRLRVNAAISLIQALTLPAYIVLIFVGADQLQQIGDILKKLVNNIGETPITGSSLNEALPAFPVDQNPLIAAFLFLGLFVLSGSLFSILVGYELVTVVLTIVGVFVWAMYGLGERTQKLFSWILACFFVTGVIGIPVVLALTQIAQVFSNMVPAGDDNLAFSVVILSVAIAFGLLAQPVLVWLMFKWTNKVYGKVITKNKDRLRAVLDNKRRLETHMAGRIRTTVSHKFDQMRVSTVNAGVDKLDSVKKAYAAKAVISMNNIANPERSTAAVAGKNLAKSGAVAASVAAKLVPHPAAKVGAGAAAAVLTKLGGTNLPRAKGKKPHA